MGEGGREGGRWLEREGVHGERRKRGGRGRGRGERGKWKERGRWRKGESDGERWKEGMRREGGKENTHIILVLFNCHHVRRVDCNSTGQARIWDLTDVEVCGFGINLKKEQVNAAYLK